MNQPLVSIIIVSHNQGDFVREAIHSAVNQSYPNVEIIVVDDGSQDHTQKEIEALGINCKKILFPKSTGYCKAFNSGFTESNGRYIIDLSGDDVLMSSRVEQGVASLQASGAGVDFCDAFYIDEKSNILEQHYRRDSHNRLLDRVASGDIFKDILERYFICTPTMMMDRQVLDRLGGYDESLYYEDFDFWVRSSRHFKYHFTDKPLVKKRVHRLSMSKTQYLPNSKMLESTLRVCEKAFRLCRSPQELESLAGRLRYELRQAIISNNYSTAEGLYKLLTKVQPGASMHLIWNLLISLGWNLSFLTRFIGRAR